MLGQTEFPILIFDRDGTLIFDTGYIKSAKDIRVIPSMPEMILRLRKYPLRIGVVSNQSGVGRGYFTVEEAQVVHEAFVYEYSRHEVAFDFIEYCFHSPCIGCSCRKPQTGLIKDSKIDYLRDSRNYFMVGDKESDRDFATRLGAEFYLMNSMPNRSSVMKLEGQILRWLSHVGE
jgi:histidinol-phosphate phosphatase family protein